MSVPFSISYSSSCHLWLLVVISLVHLCLSDQNSGDVLCMGNERHALMRFKHGLIDETDRLASWVGEKNDCCKWSGIVCDNITGHVHEIHLRGLDGHCDELFKDLESIITLEEFVPMLGGNLSPSLLELKQLQYLDLSCNFFDEIPIPSFIGSLINLRYLNLSKSYFGGMIPPQIGNLSELRVLSLRNTYLISTMYMQNMQWLSSLRWLHHLNIGSIDLSKANDWFQVINTLPSLVKLDLSRCQLIDMHSHVSSLNITSLTELDLSFNRFDNTSIPPWIFSQTSLVLLDLTACNFHNTLPGSIYSFSNLTSLEALHASSNNFMNSPSILKGLSGNLKLLDIKSCGISSSVLHSMCNMTSLLSLDVAENQLTKAIPKSFGNLCNLRSIDLSRNNFSDIGLTDFHTSLFDCKSSSLESLSMSSSGLSGPIPNSIRRLSSLKRLNLTFNILNGSIPDWIGQLSSLEVLDLSYNQLSGNLPARLGQLSMLKDLSISGNLLKGVVTEAHFAKLVSLKSLRGEGNNLTLKVQVANWIPPFQMKFLYLNSWRLGPEFPLWFQSQRDLTHLAIRNTHISSTMPPESFWKSLPNLIYLDMSQNHIKGTLTSFPATTINKLDLSSNMFTGKLPSLSNGSLMPTYLDLSNNSFVGSLHHFLCINSVVETNFLSLGYNHLSGVIPECWEKWPLLSVLNLEINNFSGEIPSSLGSLLCLEWLNMHGNKISGRLPSSLMNLSNLAILQLGNNELVGSIPTWIGTKLTSLGLLNLRSNNLDGHIPHELCYLSNTQVLDLANNNLSGDIPRCFNDFSVLSGMITYPGQAWEIYLELTSVSASDTLVMKGQEHSYKSFLRLVTLLDLSCNNLSGHIPGELTCLHNLKALNLSGNHLSGKIPENIGDMKELESFDLSVNKLYGELPTSLSRLNFLSSFNVSYNNLTGRVPISTQLQSFSESSFFSNKLCGAPLRDCLVQVEVPAHTIGNHKEDAEQDWGLIISIVLGLLFGFWIIVAPLLVNTSWRVSYYILMRKVIRV